MQKQSIESVTAAMLVIGDEILSGRTKDKNIGFVADYLNTMGIDLVEVRIVSDETDHIVEAVNETNRVVQVGTWQRHDHNFRLAAEMVRQGRIGQLKRC